MKNEIYGFIVISAVFSHLVNSQHCAIPSIDYAIFQGPNGSVFAGDYLRPGERIQVDCIFPFLLKNGSNSATCDARGNWQFTSHKFNSFGTCISRQEIYEECGRNIPPSGRIFGGDKAQLGEFPWMTRLQIMYEDKSKVDVCGGAIVDKDWILTAAHCLVNGRVASVLVHVGHVNYSSAWTPTLQQRTVSSRDILIHSNYGNGTALNYDFALLRLNFPIQFTENVRKVCLPGDNGEDMCPTNADGSKNFDSPTVSDDCRRVSVAGFGMNESLYLSGHLMKLSISVSRNSACEAPDRPLSEAQLCAGGIQNGQGTCMGDSGGSMVCRRDGKYYAIGIVSFGINLGCGIAEEPTVFSRICAVVPWIRQTISGIRDLVTSGRQLGSTSPSTTTTKQNKCLAISRKVPNGRLAGRGRNEGATRRLVCNRGFIATGNRTTVCSSRQWTAVGRCMPEKTTATIRSTTKTSTTSQNAAVHCKWRVPTVRNGHIGLHGRIDRSLGGRNLVICHHGHQLVGNAHVACRPNGRWERPGVCRPIESRGLPSTMHTSRLQRNQPTLDEMYTT